MIPIRLLLMLVLAGIVANFLIYSLDTQTDENVVASWKSLSGPNNSTSTHVDQVAAFLGAQSAKSKPANITDASHSEDASVGTFIHQGITYRLSALIVAGKKSFATVIDEAGTVYRLGIGDPIPTGETIVVIDKTELILQLASGELLPLEIY